AGARGTTARTDRRRSAKERCRFRVDYMHMPQIGHQRHALTGVAGRRRGHPRSDFDRADVEEHHRFHAHPLDNIEKGVEFDACGGAFKRR
ncbi:MAG: hypothetical protein VX612_06920, partial [Pseudomonadota bacterium]|nr:hypothetical protein [Pseudomonadota bacterium]